MKEYGVAFYDLVGYLVPGFCLNLCVVVLVCLYRGHEDLLLSFLNMGVFYHLVLSYMTGHIVQIISKPMAKLSPAGIKKIASGEKGKGADKYATWWAGFERELREQGKDVLLAEVRNKLLSAGRGVSGDESMKNGLKYGISFIDFRLADSQIFVPYLRQRIDTFRALRGFLRALMCVCALAGASVLLLGVFKGNDMHFTKIGFAVIHPYQLIAVGVVLLLIAYLARARFISFEEKRLRSVVIGLFCQPNPTKPTV